MIVGSISIFQGGLLRGGESIFLFENFHPEPDGGVVIQFDLLTFFKWLGDQLPTRKGDEYDDMMNFMIHDLVKSVQTNHK